MTSEVFQIFAGALEHNVTYMCVIIDGIWISDSIY
jgi:hypothetical protein